jgi:glycosyltransferase involved in cell wall biosynthesis
VKADIIGSGPLEADVRRMVDAAGVASLITVHGFVPDHADVERLLSLGAVAVAPYQRDPASFSRYADPGKLKAYLGAGLPILLTDVPPNAHDIATHGGGELVDDNGCSLADAIARLLDDPEEWCRRRAQAIAYSQTFDWPHVLDKALKEMGFVA